MTIAKISLHCILKEYPAGTYNVLRGTFPFACTKLLYNSIHGITYLNNLTFAKTKCCLLFEGELFNLHFYFVYLIDTYREGEWW